ncbi:MAG: alpha/beta hydrolase [Candidatus Thiodiazotropha sp. (ex Codakia rugifera)]|nr:alpha/beta hydrolase [Candidatus Thiodiazotropha sp. (ex Codakia rugifera)]
MIASIYRTLFRNVPGSIGLVCLLLTGSAASEVVHEKLENGLMASAYYLPSDGQNSPILILHGFLQTWDFFTVRRIATALHEAGHPVLLPNLTLGIENRRQSLACEAVHNHSMYQDVSEIAFWVKWLSHDTGRPITLIGHSAGSLTLVAYLDRYHDAPVGKSILISLIAFAQGPVAKENKKEQLRAEADLHKATDKLHSYRLAYCDKFITTPVNYLSYLTWNQQRTLDAIVRMDRKPSIILGSNDNRLGSDWKQQLQALEASVIEIEGADHFFDHSHEFDLLDSIEQLL